MSGVVELLDPHAEPTAATTTYALGLGDDIETKPVRIALLANNFADSVTFLEHVQRALAVRLPSARFLFVQKPNPSVLVDDALFDEVMATCDAVVGAYGH